MGIALKTKEHPATDERPYSRGELSYRGFAVKIINGEGKFVLLFSDGGYAAKSWQEQVTSGIAADKEKQKASLAWIREQSLDPMCVESLANHDPDIEPHVIEL